MADKFAGLADKGLLPICYELHNYISLQPLHGLSHVRAVVYVDYLRKRLNEWKPIISEYDLRVKDLVAITIDGYDESLE